MEVTCLVLNIFYRKDFSDTVLHNIKQSSFERLKYIKLKTDFIDLF